MIVNLSSSLLLLLGCLQSGLAFNIPSSKKTVEFSLYTYSRGADDIWPPTNEEPIQLQDSFPRNAEIDVPITKTRPRRFDKVLVLVAASLIQYMQPMDGLTVIALSGYWTILHHFSKAKRADGTTPLLPALPPQGHTPTLVSSPLGRRRSPLYSIWNKLGMVLGLWLPYACLFLFQNNNKSVGMARPLFVLCCQSVTESIVRRKTCPLPIQILVPILYGCLRLYYLSNWAFAPVVGGVMERVLAIANLLYTIIHLFGFVIPVLSMKYLRAHFFCVEAQSVVVRRGLEETVGLSP